MFLYKSQCDFYLESWVKSRVLHLYPNHNFIIIISNISASNWVLQSATNNFILSFDKHSLKNHSSIRIIWLDEKPSEFKFVLFSDVYHKCHDYDVFNSRIQREVMFIVYMFAVLALILFYT